MLRRLAVGCVSAALVVLVGFVGMAWADITTTEGQSFSGTVADIGGCFLSSASIDWGDGTMSAGVSDGGTGVQGTHTYSDEGTYNATVSYTCNNFSGVHTATFQATVQDASLTGAGRDSSGTAGQSLSAVVAHIDDSNPAAGANDFSAQITWGDGTTTAGSVAAAAGGGFDVTGTHTYNTAGSYTVSTTITDVGGSTASANSTGQIAAAPPPPPPPPPLAGPQARFTFAPSIPCSTDSIMFDASTSTRTRRLIAYRWSIDDPTSVLAGNPPVPSVVTTKPTFTHAFGPAYTTIGQRVADSLAPVASPLGYFDAAWPAFDVRIFRPPVTVTLQVTDRAGETASTTRRITFRNPDEAVVMAYDTKTCLINSPGCDENGLEVDFSRPVGIVPGSKACDSRSALQKRGLAALKLRPTVLATARAGYLQLSGRAATLTVRLSCHYAQLGCDGGLVVLANSRRRAPRRNPQARVLGHAVFLARPGRRSATVTIKLNAYGTALARSHKLRRVTLSLVSAGPTGRIVVTSRTIQLRTRR